MNMKCGMQDDCKESITHIDCKGYIYCSKHGEQRKAHTRCRKLTKQEREQLALGLSISRF